MSPESAMTPLYSSAYPQVSPSLGSVNSFRPLGPGGVVVAEVAGSIPVGHPKNPQVSHRRSGFVCRRAPASISSATSQIQRTAKISQLLPHAIEL